MTCTRLAKIAAALSLTLAAGIAAADTQSVSVTASVTGVCKFNTGQTPVLAFGAIDPTGSAAKTASVDVLFKCTKGQSATVAATGGLSRTLAGPSSSSMPYTVTLTGASATGAGFGSSTDLTLTVGGSVAVADYQNATVGSYTDTISLTVTP